MTARVLITRPAGSWPAVEARFAGSPVELQWDPTTVSAPPLDPAPGARVLDRIDRYDWLVTTSGRGVAALRRQLADRHVAPERLRLRVAAVGPATGRLLESAGFEVAVVAEESSSRGLAAALGVWLSAGARVLVVGPEGPRGPLAGYLRRPGIQVDEAPLYRTAVADRATVLADEAVSGRFTAVVITAPSSLDLWLEAAGARRDELAAALGRVKRVAIGPTTGARLAALGLPADEVSKTPREDEIGDAIVRALPGIDLLT